MSTGGWWALGGAAVSLILKMCITDTSMKTFEWHKHGYDMCIMTLGTSLSAGCYAIGSDDFLRPQLRPLAVVFVVSLIFTFLTSGNSRAIEAEAVANPHQKCIGLKSFNIMAGVFAIMINMYVLVVKDTGTPKHPPVPAHTPQLLGGGQ